MANGTDNRLRAIDAPRCELGEGMRYDRETNSLRWVDIPRRKSFSRRPDGAIDDRRHVEDVAFTVTLSDGTTIAAEADGFRGDGISGVLKPPGLNAGQALNDGAVHPSGACLVFGSRDREEARELGHMWIMGQEWKRLPWRFTVFNGPAFSPDGRLIYFTDSPTGTIWRAAFDAVAQDLGEREVFAQVAAEEGLPDGMACDDEGGLWVAFWDGGCLRRFRPDGALDREVALPAERVTSLAFLNGLEGELAVTTAKSDNAVQGDGRRQEPSGHVFFVKAGVSGPASPRLDAAVPRRIPGVNG